MRSSGTLQPNGTFTKLIPRLAYVASRTPSMPEKLSQHGFIQVATKSLKYSQLLIFALN